MFKNLARIICVGLLPAILGVAHAQFPDKPIRVITPYEAGGPLDVVLRSVAEEVQQRLGQPMLVVTKAGGGGLISIQEAVKSPPDGYTILAMTSTVNAHPGMFAKLPYDMNQDLLPLTRLVVTPVVIVVNPSLPVSNLKELVELSKKTPGGLSYGSAGIASTPHIIGELFKKKTGINMTHIPYKGEAAAVNELMGGRTQVVIAGAAGAMPFIRSGRVKALAVTTSSRVDVLPTVPTVVESGYPSVDAVGWLGLALPAHTPPIIVNTLYDAVSAALQQKAVNAKLTDLGLSVAPMPPAEFKKYINDQTNLFTDVIRSANIRE